MVMFWRGVAGVPVRVGAQVWVVAPASVEGPSSEPNCRGHIRFQMHPHSIWDVVDLFWCPLPRNLGDHAAELSALACVSPRRTFGVVEVDVHRLHRCLLLGPVETRRIRRRRGCGQIFANDGVNGLWLRWLDGRGDLHPRPLTVPCHRQMV